MWCKVVYPIVVFLFLRLIGISFESYAIVVQAQERDNVDSIMDLLYENGGGALSMVDTLGLFQSTVNCITPQMYGAVGDGITDDTQALREALYHSNKQCRILFFPAGKQYKVTGTLNYYNGQYQNYKLNMVGSLPVKMGSYSATKYGGIQLSAGVSLFKNAKISGSIKSMSFTGKRRDDVVFFDNCTCSAFVLTESNISNFGVMFLDTPVYGVSQITCNTFLTVFYFSKNEKTSSGFTDSTISFNYINGGKEKKDNVCFEWGYYNGALVTNNFIDYYRTMYYPVVVKKQTFVGPVSSNNHYQVFRYLYDAPSEIQSVKFYSGNDAFNWNDPTCIEVDFEPKTYKGKDGKIYEMPPYIAVCRSSWVTVVKGAKIERKIRPLIYIAGSPTEYEHCVFDVEFCGNNQYKGGQINFAKGTSAQFYNSGKYMNNRIHISGAILVVDELPKFIPGWCCAVNGLRVLYKKELYEATNFFDDGKWKAKWEKVTM